jgi:hypothetical protein
VLIEVAKALAPIRLQLCKTVLQNGKKNSRMRNEDAFLFPVDAGQQAKEDPEPGIPA